MGTMAAGTHCRCADKTKGTGKADAAGACKIDLTSCGTLITLPAGSCAQAMSSSYGWKSATDFSCATMLSTQCRCADGTVGTGARATGLSTCAACPAASTTGAAGAGESGEAGEGEGEAGAAGEDAKASGAFVALALMIINLF